MSLIDKVTADKSAVAAAQSALDVANIQLNIDESALAAVQPKLDLVTQLEALAASSASTEFTYLLGQLRVLLEA